MRYALITGADHGIGLELVRQMLGRGYHVTACRLNPKETAVDELALENEGSVQVITLDVGRDDSVEALAREAERTLPRLDVLINCAGILGDMYKTVGDALDYDEMLRVINVNALGPLRVTNALADLLKKGEGKLIVNISSEAGSIQDCWREGWFGYCMSKAANNMQGAIVQNALKKAGVRVVQMHPGHVATYMRGHLDTTASITPDVSAEGILRVALDTPLPESEHPLFLDWQGNALRY